MCDIVSAINYSHHGGYAVNRHKKLGRRQRCPIQDLEREAMATMYERDKLALQAIADYFRVSRQAVYKVLLKRGVDTSKATGCKVAVRCAWCGVERLVVRSRARKHVHSYCNRDHWIAHLNSGDAYLPNRRGQKLGRATIELIYGPLPDGSVVHHVDKNDYNNDPVNLMLFASSADHLRFHRLGERSMVVALWDGRVG